MGNHRKQEKTKSFWTSLPGVLTEVAGLVTAVAGLIMVWPCGESENSSNSERPVHRRLVDPDDLNCIASSPERMPYYLRNTIKGSRGPLYWFKLDVSNRTERKVIAEVFFGISGDSGDPWATVETAGRLFTIDSLDSVAKYIDPEIEILNATKVLRLAVDWRVQDFKSRPLSGGTEYIDVLPNRTIDWDLETPAGDRMPAEFLVASLSAWTKTPDLWVRSYANSLSEQLRDSLRSANYSTLWVEKVYSDVFDSIGVLVPSELRDLKGSYNISLPSTIIEQRQGHPLELGLMFCNLALAREGPGISTTDFALICVPGQISPDCKLLFCWSDDDVHWQAIDLVSANDLDYVSNRDSATIYLNSLLTDSEWIVKDLKSTGVAIADDSSLFALDVRKAAETFGIGALP